MRPFALALPAALLLLPAIALAAPTPRGAFLEERFAQIDLDGDGRVTRQEFEQHRSSRFRNADSNGDGSLSEAEFMAAGRDRFERHARRFFGRLDSDGNGSVSSAEFQVRGPGFSRLDADGDGAVEIRLTGGLPVRASRPGQRPRCGRPEPAQKR